MWWRNILSRYRKSIQKIKTFSVHRQYIWMKELFKNLLLLIGNHTHVYSSFYLKFKAELCKRVRRLHVLYIQISYSAQNCIQSKHEYPESRRTLEDFSTRPDTFKALMQSGSNLELDFKTTQFRAKNAHIWHSIYIRFHSLGLPSNPRWYNFPCLRQPANQMWCGWFIRYQRTIFDELIWPQVYLGSTLYGW